VFLFFKTVKDRCDIGPHEREILMELLADNGAGSTVLEAVQIFISNVDTLITHQARVECLSVAGSKITNTADLPIETLLNSLAVLEYGLNRLISAVRFFCTGIGTGIEVLLRFLTGRKALRVLCSRLPSSRLILETGNKGFACRIPCCEAGKNLEIITRGERFAGCEIAL
jgi:hypothetical protein